MKKVTLGALLAGLLSLWPSLALADAEVADLPTRTARVEPFERVARFELGYRGSFITTSGYNPFSTRDYLPQLSIGASRTIAARGRWSFAPGITWDVGSSSALTRGDEASLTVNRLTVTLEGRVRFGRWGYAFLRAAPGVALEHVEVDDPSVPGRALTKSRWLFAVDLSAGYAYPLWSRSREPQLFSRLWAQADGGYGLVADHELNLSASGQARADGIDLGVLSLRGAFFRLSLAASL